MFPKYKKWLFLAIVALIPILSGCDGCDKKKYVAPPPAPSAPSNLSGTAVSSTEIDLAWKDNSTNEKGFYVYRRTTNSYARIAILDVNAISYNDTGLDPETSYWYKVKAYNDGGESGSSNEVNVRTLPGTEPSPEPLEPPTNVRADVVSYKLVLLSWEDNSSDEDGFRVRCRMDETVYLTIATVGPDSTLFRHDFLQPMTALEYYVEVYRGDESVGSEQAYATTTCPVIILNSEIDVVSNRKRRVTGEIESFADEPCATEIAAHFYHKRTGELMGTATGIFNIEPWGTTDFEINWTQPQEQEPGSVWTDYDVEVTDVEIEY